MKASTSSPSITTRGQAATAYRLAFGQQPTDTPKNSVITPPVTALILDAYGNQTSSTAEVTISKTVAQGPDLAGTVMVNAVNGIATFDNITVKGSGRSYTLVLTGTGLLPSDPSTQFNVS